MFVWPTYYFCHSFLGKYSLLMEMGTISWLLQGRGYEPFCRTAVFSGWLNASTECVDSSWGRSREFYGVPRPQPGHARCFHEISHTVFPIPTQNIGASHFTHERTEAQSLYVTLPGHRGSSHRTLEGSDICVSCMLCCLRCHFGASPSFILFLDSGHAAIMWGLNVLFCDAFPDTSPHPPPPAHRPL